MAWTPPSDAVEWKPPTDAVEWVPPSDATEIASQKTTDQLLKEHANLGTGKQLAQGYLGAGEAALQMLSGLPSFVTNSAGKLGALAQGKFTEEELNAAGEAATPDIFHDITYEPRTAFGQLASRGVSEGFRQVGRGLAAPGAAVQATVGNGGSWGDRFKKSYEQTAPITQAALEIGLVGKGGKDYYDTRVAARKSAERKLVEDELAVKPTTPAPAIEPGMGPILGNTPNKATTRGTARAGESAELLKGLPPESPIPAGMEGIVQGGRGSGVSGVKSPATDTAALLKLVEEKAITPEQAILIDPAMQGILGGGRGSGPKGKAGAGEGLMPKEATAGSGIFNNRTFNQSGAINPKVFEEGMAAFAHRIADIVGNKYVIKDIVQGKVLNAAERESMITEAVRTKTVTHPTTGKVLGGIGKKGFGQGGSMGLFARETFDQFSKRFIKDNPDLANATPEALRRAYDKLHPDKTVAAQKAEAVDNIPGMRGMYNKYESRPVETDPLGLESVKRMEAVGTVDLATPVGAIDKGMFSAGRLMSWAKKSPIVHEAVQFVTSVKDFYRIKSANTISPINGILRSFEMGFNGLTSHSWKDAAEVFKLRREHEFDPNFNPASVLSGKKLELFQKIDTITKDLYQQINKRRKELDSTAQDLPQLPYYFTSFFVGDWAIPIFDRTTGKFLFNLRESSKGEALKAKDWANNHPDFVAKDVGLMKQSKYADRRLDAASDFDTLMRVFGSSDPAVIAAMQRMAAASAKTAYSTAGMPSRFLNKSGRIGSMGDKPWKSDKQNYYDNKEAFTRYVEGANEWLGNTTIAKMTENMSQSKVIDAPNAKAYLQDYADYVIGRKAKTDSMIRGVADTIGNAVGRSGADVTGFARKWANLNTALFIGFYSVRAMAQNSVQWVQATAPRMVQLHTIEGIKGDMASATVLGLFEGMYDTIGHSMFPKAVKDVIGTKALKFKEDHHVVDAHLVESGRMGKNVWNNLAYDFFANKSVAATEHMSRSISFSIYTKYLESAGFDKARAMDMAKNLTHETMVNYESYSKPQMFGATGVFGEMAGRLQTYKMNSATQVSNYARDIKLADPKSFAPLGTALAINIAFAGMMGLIGMDIAELMLEGVKLADRSVGEPTPELQEFGIKRFIFENAPDWVSMGALSKATDANLSGAFSQNLVGDNPLKSIVPVFGGAVDQIQAPAKIAFGKDDSTVAQGLSALAPASAKPYIEEAYSTADLPTGEKQVLSPHTGKTVWKGADQGYKTSGHGVKWNIQSLERGKYAAEERNQRMFEKGVKDSVKAVGDSISRQTVDLYKNLQAGKNTAFQMKAIEKKLNTYLDAGGDPNAAVEALNTQLTELGIGDEMLVRIMHDVSLGTRKQFQHALEAYQRREGTQ